MPTHSDFMQRAIALSELSLEHQGGPFGAIIVKHRQIIGEGFNQVSNNNDPTAHAEIIAIRQACQQQQNFSLQNCILYSSCEPCPMCLAAAYWARIEAIYFANDQHQAARAGFSDQYIYAEFKLDFSARHLPMQHLPLKHADKALYLWQQKTDKITY